MQRHRIYLLVLVRRVMGYGQYLGGFHLVPCCRDVFLSMDRLQFLQKNTMVNLSVLSDLNLGTPDLRITHHEPIT